MNKLIVSQSISQILESNPSINNNRLKKDLSKQGINISKSLIDELKTCSNMDRELLEIEILKKSMNVNY